MEGLSFSCPVCGADVPRKAKACPECGACDKSGWSEDQYLDGLNLPGEELPTRSQPHGMSRFWWVVTVIVLLAFALLTLRGLW